MWILQRTLPPDWLLVAPRAILTDPNGGYSWILQERGQLPHISDFDPAVDALIKLVDSLPALYQANPNEIYLMGFSQGTAVAFAAVLQYPERFKALASLLGFVPQRDSAANSTVPFNQLPVFFASGNNDPYIPPQLTEYSIQFLKESGAKLTHRTYNNGHKLNAQAMRDLKTWWEKVGIGD